MVSCEICQDSCIDENPTNNDKSGTTKNVISAFAPLAANTAKQTVPNGDEASVRKAATLPQTLTATVDGKSQTISGIKWELGGTYQQKDKEQTITFTAKLPGGYSLKSGVSLPTITVTVKAKDTVIKVTSFAELPDDVKTQTVPNGNEENVQKSAKLPENLTAIIDGESQIINGITWELDNPPYEQKDEAQTITFTAKLPDGYAADGVNLPKITVTVKGKTTITAFAQLDENTATQIVPNGDEASVLAAVKMPNELTATVDGESQAISGIVWIIDKPYEQKDDAQTITFTAKLPDGYKLDKNAELPTITVKVYAKGAEIEITSFAELDDDVKTQTVPNGDEESVLAAVKMPEELSTTVDGISQTIRGVTWEIDNPPYEQKDEAQTITFTAKLPDGYTADDAALPKINVTVKAKPTITAFAPLAEKIAKQSVSNGDEASVRKAATLPQTLTATVDGESQAINGITWEIDNPPYEQKDEAQTITFTAKLPDGYKLDDGAALPKIEVTVQMKDGDYWPLTIENGVVIACDPEATGDIVIHDGVTSIKEKAFNACSKIESVVIPDSVTSIEFQAFKDCSGLTSITIPFVGASKDGTKNRHFGYIFGAKDYYHFLYDDMPKSIKTVVITGGTFIPEEAFRSCDIESVTLPDSITSIKDDAFYSCNGLKSITLPDGLETIEKGAFYGCYGLESITIPDSVTFIEQGAFDNCKKDNTITVYYNGTIQQWYALKNDSCLDSCLYGFAEQIMVEGVDLKHPADNTKVLVIDKDIRDEAYINSSELISVTIKEGVKSIGNKAFANCKKLASVEIPSSVTSIGAGVFSGCENLTSVTIPNGVTSIGDCAFDQCNSLTEITLPESVTSIGSKAFYFCKNLTDVEIPNSIISIGSEAFNSCEGLTSVTIPNGTIGDKAFYYCENLESVTISEGVTSIGSKAFNGCKKIISIKIPSSVNLIASRAFNYTLENIDVESGNTVYHSEGNCLIETATEKLVLAGKDCTIPNDGSVKIIGTNAFPSYCDYPISVVIPDSVTTIEKEAFYEFWGLTSVTIPNSVTEIGTEAFRGCKNLTSVEIPDSITSIKDGTFHDCKLESVTIPNSVTSIGIEAFRSCSNLTSVTIPDSVTTIKRQAFCSCENLSTINYGGTKEQWGQVTKVSNWHYNVPAATVNCLGDGSEADLDYTAP